MKFTVSWKPESERRLLEIWMNAADREEMTNAVAQIEDALRRDPEHAGESREGEFRVVIAPPIAVMFRVVPDDRFVEVGLIWRIDELESGSE